MSIATDIKRDYRHGGTLTRLILINVGIFVAYSAVRVVLYLSGHPVGHAYARMLAVPADAHQLLLRPWTAVSYMFFHEEVLHIAFNMLWLYWFGQIFMQGHTPQQLRGVYLLGGLSGAVLFVLAYNLLPAFNPHGAMALSASAAAMAVMFACASRWPNQPIGLLLVGTVRLKHLALALVIIDVASIPLSNAGGHIAHLGGALYGLAFTGLLRRGHDISRPLAKLRHQRTPIAPNHAPPRRPAHEQRIDRILDKISRSGYDSLSTAEKAALFKNKGGSA